MSLLYLLFVCSIVAILPSTASEPILNATMLDYIHGGNGCPQGSRPTLRLDVVNATTGTYQLTAQLHHLLATTDLATHSENTRCTTAINIATDAGYRLRVNSRGSEVQGSIKIADNTTTAQFRAAYDWIGRDIWETSVSSLWFTGPARGSFLKRTPVEDGGVMSECGSGFLRENFQVRLNHTGTRNSYVPPDPKVDGYEWVVVTEIEVVKC
ncbi:hypothetical protein P154DRAFT_583393 [Amniculicola lignicola CBS 123094]|uniref:Secreted protein n=1 Tax=Amniculicola lignicola CBS 123094 TaxID=1392246 RepID=A0A6A5VY85_9PLEO|nr:hypothetical protein P154DRAFT_583393 [Amniculicola lignicola CBS 123094]